MLGNLPTDYKQQELKARAAAEAAALANINPDGGRYKVGPHQEVSNDDPLKEYWDQFNKIGSTVLNTVVPDPTNPAEVAEATLDMKMAIAMGETPITATGLYIGKRAAKRLIEPVISNVRGLVNLPDLAAGLGGTGGAKAMQNASKLSSGQLRLLNNLTPEALKEVADPGLKMLYEKAAKILNTPRLSKRNAEVLLQTGPDSPLLKVIEKIDDPVELDKAITGYFTKHGQYFSGGFNFNLDHLVPVSSVAKLASKVKPAVFQEALALQFKKFNRRFGHDQEFSLIPRRTHAAKHTGSTQAILEGMSPDWKTKYLDEFIDDLPENASAEQVSEALSKMYDKSLQETGKALSDPDFFSIREGVLESLPSEFREKLGDNFDITGRISSVETPELWKEFKGYLRGAPPTVKTIMQKASQVAKIEEQLLKQGYNAN